eukprot:jgi/Mesvir1/3193/Mv16347-RA.3
MGLEFRGVVLMFAVLVLVLGGRNGGVWEGWRPGCCGLVWWPRMGPGCFGDCWVVVGGLFAVVVVVVGPAVCGNFCGGAGPVLLPSSSPSLPHQRRPEPLVRSSGVSAALRGTKVWSAPPVRQEGSDKVEEEDDEVSDSYRAGIIERLLKSSQGRHAHPIGGLGLGLDDAVAEIARLEKVTEEEREELKRQNQELLQQRQQLESLVGGLKDQTNQQTLGLQEQIKMLSDAFQKQSELLQSLQQQGTATGLALRGQGGGGGGVLRGQTIEGGGRQYSFGGSVDLGENFNDGSADCADVEPLCPDWSAHGECKRNPGYMLRQCKQSCRVPCVDFESHMSQVAVSQLSWEPRAYRVANLLTRAECEYLKELARPQLKRARVTTHEGGAEAVDAVRTSLSMFVTGMMESNPVVMAVDKRVAVLTQIPAEHQEAMQVLKYEFGQYYHTHRDFFKPLPDMGPGDHPGTPGQQRIVTVLMYLSDVAKGGETHFPLAVPMPGYNETATCGGEAQKTGVSVIPKMGDAIMILNRKEDETMDPKSSHAGCPVLAGEKWVIAKWIRDGPLTSATSQGEAVESEIEATEVNDVVSSLSRVTPGATAADAATLASGALTRAASGGVSAVIPSKKHSPTQSAALPSSSASKEKAVEARAAPAKGPSKGPGARPGAPGGGSAGGAAPSAKQQLEKMGFAPRKETPKPAAKGATATSTATPNFAALFGSQGGGVDLGAAEDDSSFSKHVGDDAHASLDGAASDKAASGEDDADASSDQEADDGFAALFVRPKVRGRPRGGVGAVADTSSDSSEAVNLGEVGGTKAGPAGQGDDWAGATEDEERIDPDELGSVDKADALGADAAEEDFDELLGKGSGPGRPPPLAGTRAGVPGEEEEEVETSVAPALDTGGSLGHVGDEDSEDVEVEDLGHVGGGVVKQPDQVIYSSEAVMAKSALTQLPARKPGAGLSAGLSAAAGTLARLTGGVHTGGVSVDEIKEIFVDRIRAIRDGMGNNDEDDGLGEDGDVGEGTGARGGGVITVHDDDDGLVDSGSGLDDKGTSDGGDEGDEEGGGEVFDYQEEETGRFADIW